MRFFGPRSTRAPNDPRELRRRATKAARGGDYQTVLECFTTIEALKPGDPNLALKVADAARRAGRDDVRLNALERAARGYERVGLPRKALAVYKMIVAARPGHEGALAKIEAIDQSRPRGLDRLGYFRRSPSQRPEGKGAA